MSYFAIQVHYGQESSVLDKITKRALQEHITDIKGAILPTVEQKKFIGEDHYILTPKSIAPTYLFIELHRDDVEMPSNVYYFLKSILGITNIMKMNIPEQEVKAFCENMNTCLEESEVILELDQAAEFIDEPEWLDNTNIEKHSLPNQIHKLKEIIKCAQEKKIRLVEKIHMSKRNHKAIFTFPLGLFLIIRKLIDPAKKMTIREITNPTFIFREMVLALERVAPSW